ncbi:diguanylate cyclase [Pseudooceanicola spongiae]|uniref:diguanylate cyclase n=2 Tax=Pseudooceanicola spongiae TaxID=2613965 RepID=A0A7L9WMH5_9RHOB|nr:diguanylate cyclase [Pseudooceanicola spongiae]
MRMVWTKRVESGPVNLQVDLNIVVAIASINVVVSLLILLIDNWKRTRKGLNTSAEESLSLRALIVVHLAFIFGTASMTMIQILNFWVITTLVIAGALGGIIAAYVAARSTLGLAHNARRWLLIWAGLTVSSMTLAMGLKSLPLLMTATGVINMGLSGLFCYRIWRAGRLSSTESRVLLALPFAAISLTYFGRLAMMVWGAEKDALLVATAVVAYVLAFSTFTWVFAAMSIRAHHLNQRLDWAARHDPLTGLENRRSLTEMSRQWPNQKWAQLGRRIICACIDLDHFKSINDTYGHEAGDMILEATAKRLQVLLQGENGRIFRVGGDEFLLWQEVSEGTNVEMLLAELLDCLSMEIKFRGRYIRPSVSIGYCDTVLPLPVDDLIRRADNALYQSKEGGRGRFSRHHDEISPIAAEGIVPAAAQA